MQVVINFDNFQEADTGETTYYGGTISINGIAVQAHGSDRGSEIYHLIKEELERQIGRELSDEEQDSLDCGYETGSNSTFTI